MVFLFIVIFYFHKKKQKTLISYKWKLQGLYIGGGLDAGHLGFSAPVNSGLLMKILATIIVGSYVYMYVCAFPNVAVIGKYFFYDTD